MRSPLIVIPTYVATPEAAAVTRKCLRTVARTAYDADVMVVDDGSPRALDVINACKEHGFRIEAKPDNEGFSRTVNVGLAEALDQGRDAILVNADVEFGEYRWWEGFYDGEGLPWRDVQGALLVFPGDNPPIVQHAGIYFSVLRREFDHIGRMGPVTMPFLREQRRCPVTAALMHISIDCLDSVGLFDESFRLGWEDVDYCIRVFEDGRDCIYNPSVWAVHHESVFRGSTDDPKLVEWQMRSMKRLWDKHAGTDFSGYVPTALGV